MNNIKLIERLLILFVIFQALLEEADGILNAIDGITTIHGRFYLLQSQLYKTLGETAEYYRSALKFLGCTDIKTLPLAEQREHAKHLAVAALASDGIYNFGELVRFN